MKPDPSRAGHTFNEGATRHDMMSKAFAYAHNRDDIVWMAQNTNHLQTHPAIEQAIRDSAATHADLGNYVTAARDLVISSALRFFREDQASPEGGLPVGGVT